MLVVNVAEAKAKLSEYLEAVSRGEQVLICKRNQPIAELRAVASARTEPRPVGLARGQFDVPDSFFEPLPDDLVGDFYGEQPRRQGKVAEAPPSTPCGSGKPVKRGRKP